MIKTSIISIQKGTQSIVGVSATRRLNESASSLFEKDCLLPVLLQEQTNTNKTKIPIDRQNLFPIRFHEREKRAHAIAMHSPFL